MPTVKQFERHFVKAGYRPSKVRNTGAALIGTVLPLSEKRGPSPEQLNSKHVAGWTIGNAIEAPLRKLPQEVQSYCSLESPQGQRADDAIGSILDSFGKAKLQIEDGVSDSDSLRAAARALKTRVVIDTEFPSITIVQETKDGPKETIFGPIQDSPSSFVRVMKTCTIGGSTLLGLAKGLYADLA